MVRKNPRGGADGKSEPTHRRLSGLCARRGRAISRGRLSRWQETTPDAGRAPSTSFNRKTPPSYGVPTARACARGNASTRPYILRKRRARALSRPSEREALYRTWTLEFGEDLRQALAVRDVLHALRRTSHQLIQLARLRTVPTVFLSRSSARRAKTSEFSARATSKDSSHASLRDVTHLIPNRRSDLARRRIAPFARPCPDGHPARGTTRNFRPRQRALFDFSKATRATDRLRETRTNAPKRTRAAASDMALSAKVAASCNENFGPKISFGFYTSIITPGPGAPTLFWPGAPRSNRRVLSTRTRSGLLVGARRPKESGARVFAHFI